MEFNGAMTVYTSYRFNPCSIMFVMLKSNLPEPHAATCLYSLPLKYSRLSREDTFTRIAGDVRVPVMGSADHVLERGVSYIIKEGNHGTIERTVL